MCVCVRVCVPVRRRQHVQRDMTELKKRQRSDTCVDRTHLFKGVGKSCMEADKTGQRLRYGCVLWNYHYRDPI